MVKGDSRVNGNEGGLFRGNLMIFVATLFFGINIPVAKMLIPQWMTAMDLTVFRVVGGCVLMWLASLFVKTASIKRGDWLPVVLGGAVGLSSFLILFNEALRYVDPIDVSLIMRIPRVVWMLIGAVFQHLRISRLEILGVVVAFAGALAIILAGRGGGKGSDRLLGDILALASTLCYSFYLVIIEKPSKNYRPVTLLKWVFLFATVPVLVLLPAFPHAEIFHHSNDVEPWLLIGFVLLCPTFLAYFLISPATKLIGSELVSIYQYLVPVVATVASVAVGLARLHWIQVVAMAVIIAGMAMTTVAKHRNSAGI